MALPAESLDLPLFPSAGQVARDDPARRALERELARAKEIERRALLDPSFPELERRRVTNLGRELRGLRDCHDAARHPRVRAALLEEAGRVARRIAALAARLRTGRAARRPAGSSRD